MIKFEYWSAREGYVYVYTQKRHIASKLNKDFGLGAEYRKHGRIVAWHFLVPENLLPMLIRKYDKKSISSLSGSTPENEDQTCVDFKGVTGI
jgi:hypothetical protein